MACMGAVAFDVEVTCETVHSRRRDARRRVRRWPIPIDAAIPEVDVDAGDLTDPDLLAPFTPSFIAADAGAALIDEWESAAAARASLVADVLLASEDATHVGSQRGSIRNARQGRRRSAAFLAAGFLAGIASTSALFLL